MDRIGATGWADVVRNLRAARDLLVTYCPTSIVRADAAFYDGDIIVWSGRREHKNYVDVLVARAFWLDANVGFVFCGTRTVSHTFFQFDPTMRRNFVDHRIRFFTHAPRGVVEIPSTDERVQNALQLHAVMLALSA